MSDFMRVSYGLVGEELSIVNQAGFEPGEVVKVVGHRKNCFGTLLNVQKTAVSAGLVFGTGKLFGNMPSRYFVELGG